MATKTISVAGGNWNAATAWVGSSVPVNYDDVVGTSSSGNLVINISTPYLSSFDMSNYPKTISGTQQMYVRPLSGTVNLVFNNSQTYGGFINVQPQSGAIINFTTGTNLYYVDVDGNGTINQQDDMFCDKTLALSTFRIQNAFWKTNSHSITACAVDIQSHNGGLDMSCSTITLTDENRYIWNFQEGTLITTSSKIYITKSAPSSTNYFSFNVASGATYNELEITGDNVWICSDNYFNKLTVRGSNVVMYGNQSVANLNLFNAMVPVGLQFDNSYPTTVTNISSNGTQYNFAKMYSRNYNIPTYRVAVTYADGETTLYNNKIWESLQNSNTGHDPEEGAWWTDVTAYYTYTIEKISDSTIAYTTIQDCNLTGSGTLTAQHSNDMGKNTGITFVAGTNNFVSETSCRAAWLLNDTAGNATDSSAFGHTLTVFASVTYGDAGKFGKCFGFDGDSAYLRGAASTDYRPGTGDFSITAYIKDPLAAPGLTTIMNHGYGSTNGWMFYYYPAGAYCYMQSVDGGLIDFDMSTSPNVIEDGWNHLAVVRSSGITKMYLNKVEQTLVDGDYWGTQDMNYNGFIYLGQYSSYYIDRSLDEVSFFKRALNYSEIVEIADYGLTYVSETSPAVVGMTRRRRVFLG